MPHKCRCIQNPDGSIRIIRPEGPRLPGETDEQYFLRKIEATLRKNPSMQGLPFVDILNTDMPPKTERAKRYAWRVQGNRVVVDPTILSPPHPKQALLTEISQATTVDSLKAILTKIVTGGG